MIELKNVCYAYGNEIALRYINLNIQKGESVIIQGPNGCGKSTLIKILNGIIFPMEGSYTYENHEITEKALKDSRFAKWFHQQIGYVFQNADTPKRKITRKEQSESLVQPRWDFPKAKSNREQTTVLSYSESKN